MKSSSSEPKYALSRIDLLVIGVFAVVIIVAFLIRMLCFPGVGQSVRITVNDDEYAVYSLAEECTLSIPGYHGGECLLSIADGAADVISADCPDKICVHHSPISQPGECIICLPNRVIVEVVGASRSGPDDLSE